MRMTDVQRRCVIEATIEPLAPFPRGYARSKMGPFYDRRTIGALIGNGALRMLRNPAGKYYRHLTARAA